MLRRKIKQEKCWGWPERSLRKYGCLSKDLKEVEEEPCGLPKEEYTRPREQPVQRPPGGTKLRVWEKMQKGQGDWRIVQRRERRGEEGEERARGRGGAMRTGR